MVLPPEERRLFFKQYLSILYFAADYESLLPETATISDFKGLPLEEKVKSRNALFTNPEIVSSFRQLNHHQLSEEGHAFVNNLRQGLYSSFVVVKQYARFAVMQEVDEQRFFHVVNITEPFSEMLGYLPVYITTAIFNFRGKLVCDGLIEGGIRIGPNIKRGMLEEYREAKAAGKVLTLLPQIS